MTVHRQRVEAARPRHATSARRPAPSGRAGFEARSTFGLHGLFEAQVERTPDALAVTCGPRSLSYAELHDLSGRFARYLRHEGLRRGGVVAIVAGPSVEQLVSILAVLKAGGCYLPIDPSTPPARLLELVRAAQPALLLTDQRSFDRLDGASAPILIDGHQARWMSMEPMRRGARVEPEDLAYVIYTSGSTGMPKGVMVPHGGIRNTIEWRQRAFPFRVSDRVLLTLSFAFDASLIQLFQPLTAGACVVVPDRELAGDPGRVIDAIRHHRITVLAFPSSFWRLLVAEPGLAACTSLRLGFCGGDPLTPDLPVALGQVLRMELHNMYGPTETSMEATHWTCTPGEQPRIGRPIDNMAAYVIGRDLRPVEEGEPGELYLSGRGLARGYLGDPMLTAARFIPDPISADPGARMYRTGDVARRVDDGSLQFLGRVDRQVKVRGQRVELDELESTLLASRLVRECAVVVRDVNPARQSLIAYVVPLRQGTRVTADLRRYLRDWLPTAMLPRIVELHALPRTTGGKVDRTALLHIDVGRKRRSFAGSSTGTGKDALERYLISTWEDALRIRGIDVDDDLFELGANSITVAVLAHRLEADLGEYVHTVSLYDSPTIRGFAGYLRATYATALARRFPAESPTQSSRVGSLVDETAIAAFDRLVRRLPRREAVPSGPANRTAVFVLTAPRSGSTLLRVMLGAHPALFAPPELQLLNFNTLGERRDALESERDRFWLQGTIRALMAADGIDVETATRAMEEYERENMTVKQFYALLQSRLGDALLVDKTPTYALDEAVLRRAEEDFEHPRYIHLVRHPAAMVPSFVEARLEAFFPPFLTGSHDFTSAEIAELVWVISQRNILRFLESVPGDRQHRVFFEDLVQQPRAAMEAIASFIGIPFRDELVEPYARNASDQMTDAIRPLARMLGDVKFHRHTGIDASAAARPAGRHPEASLAPQTKTLASRLGYRSAARGATTPTILRRAAPRLVLIHPAGGSVAGYRELARRMASRVSLDLLEPERGVEREAGSVTQLATRYLEDVRRRQREGPFRLAGWSFGGVVAFEMARQLEADGDEVALVALLSAPVVTPGAPRPPLPGDGFVRMYLAEFLQLHGLDASLARSQPDDPMVNVFTAARRAAIIAGGIRLQEFRRVIEQGVRTYEAHVRMGRGYDPPGIVSNVVLLEPADAAGHGNGALRDWDALARHVHRHTVPGDHFSMLREPNVEVVAEWLSYYTKDTVGVPVEAGLQGVSRIPGPR